MLPPVSASRMISIDLKEFVLLLFLYLHAFTEQLDTSDHDVDNEDDVSSQIE